MTRVRDLRARAFSSSPSSEFLFNSKYSMLYEKKKNLPWMYLVFNWDVLVACLTSAAAS